MAAHLRPRKWMFGDETTVEKNLVSKNTQQEAELAMRELLHKVCNCSPAETKKKILLDHTINAYRNAIAQNLNGLHSVETLFQNEKPVLQDRINCFAMDVIEKVRDHNLKRQAERVFQAKLKGSKQKKNTAQSCCPSF
jgi:hypothetical protein